MDAPGTARLHTAVVHSVFSNEHTFESELKRLAILFDRVAIVDLSTWGCPVVSWLGADRFYSLLQDHQLIYEPAEEAIDITNPRYKDTFLGYFGALSKARASRRESKFEDANRSYAQAYALFTRAAAMGMGRFEDAVPILPNLALLKDQSPAFSKAEVLRVVLPHVPTPTSSVSWETLLEFREQARSTAGLARLRDWVNGMARGQLPTVEVADRLNALLSDYREHMRVHQIKHTQSAFELCVVTTAEILESIVTFRWSKAAKGLFGLFKERVELAEAELDAPGREVAYLMDVRRAFDN